MKIETDDENEFFPQYVLRSTRVAEAAELDTFISYFYKTLDKLVERTSDFYERMMLGKGVFYTKTEGMVYFHDVYGLRFDDIPNSVFLAYFPEQKGDEFGEKADVILHLHLFSDMQLTSEMNNLNEKMREEVGHSLTHFYFNRDEMTLKKLVLVPQIVKDKRKSVIKKNKVFKVLLSETTVEDIELMKKYMMLLLRKMKKTNKSKELD